MNTVDIPYDNLTENRNTIATEHDMDVDKKTVKWLWFSIVWTPTTTGRRLCFAIPESAVSTVALASNPTFTLNSQVVGTKYPRLLHALFFRGLSMI